MSAPATQTSPPAHEQDAVLTVRDLGVAIGRHDLSTTSPSRSVGASGSA